MKVGGEFAYSDIDKTTLSDRRRWSLRRALGRRNYLFAASDSGGRRAAAIYTLVSPAKLNDLDPETLKDVLTKIAEGHPINRINDLLPWRMATAPPPPSA